MNTFNKACIAELHISVETRCRPDLDDIDAANILAVIEQLQAKIAELEEENARLKAECDDIKQVQFPRKLEAVAVGWKKRLAAAQEEIKTVTEQKNRMWFEMQTAQDQLAKAEQRVAEACACVCDTKLGHEIFKTQSECARQIRSGEWRKFVKEV